MATSPVPLWAQEMSPHHRGPTGAGVLLLALVVVLVVSLWQIASATDGGQVSPIGDSPDRGSLCDEHPRWSVCKEPPHGR